MSADELESNLVDVPRKASSLKSAVQRGLLLGIAAIMFGLPLRNWMQFAVLVPKGYGDFRAFYGAGWAIRSGQAMMLYDYGTQKALQDAHIGAQSIALPFNHLAYESLLFAPLTLLSYRWAWLAFFILNLTVLCVTYRLLRPCLRHLTSAFSWAPAALFFTFVPVAAALMQGQDSILLLALLVAAFRMHEGAKDFEAGLLLGSAMFKFQIVLPIAALYLLWRQWKLVWGFLISSLVAIVASLSIVGFSGMRLYFASVLATAGQSNQFTNGVYPYAMPNLRGLAFGLHLPVVALVLGSLAILLLASWLGASFEVAIVAAALLSYHFLIHDMSILLVPGLRALDGEEWKGWMVLLSPLLVVHAPIFYLASLLLVGYLVLTYARNMNIHGVADGGSTVIEKA